MESLQPVFIVLGNVILAIRFTQQKHSMQQENTWRKYRLMYVQLFSISALYFTIWIPFVTFSLIRLFYDPVFLARCDDSNIQLLYLHLSHGVTIYCIDWFTNRAEQVVRSSRVNYLSRNRVDTSESGTSGHICNDATRESLEHHRNHSSR